MLWILVIAAGVGVYFLVKNKKIDFPGEDKAMQELKRRYVNGEIDDETYLKMKENLKK